MRWIGKLPSGTEIEMWLGTHEVKTKPKRYKLTVRARRRSLPSDRTTDRKKWTVWVVRTIMLDEGRIRWASDHRNALVECHAATPEDVDWIESIFHPSIMLYQMQIE